MAVRGWVARCGLPPSQQSAAAFSLWLAGAIAHGEGPAVRQKLLECSTAERLSFLAPVLQANFAAAQNGS